MDDQDATSGWAAAQCAHAKPAILLSIIKILDYLAIYWFLKGRNLSTPSPSVYIARHMSWSEQGWSCS